MCSQACVPPAECIKVTSRRYECQCHHFGTVENCYCTKRDPHSHYLHTFHIIYHATSTTLTHLFLPVSNMSIHRLTCPPHSPFTHQSVAHSYPLVKLQNVQLRSAVSMHIASSIRRLATQSVSAMGLTPATLISAAIQVRYLGFEHHLHHVSSNIH